MSEPTATHTSSHTSTNTVTYTITYTVKGMTCDHCVGAVREEVGAIAGVTDVVVRLDDGSLTVTSTVPIAEAAVRAAVDEAGYELAS